MKRLFIALLGLFFAGCTQTMPMAPPALDEGGGFSETNHPLSIAHLKTIATPGSEIAVEQELSSGSNYKQYIVSYVSDGLKQYALLTEPTSEPPEGGWPVVVFNHGYIPPAQYTTTGRYIAYVDSFARQGFVVLKPDYRGHGNSEGSAQGGYGSPDYTVDVLNAVASIKKWPSVNPEKIGMWGHSMGGHITLRAMTVNPSIKAGVVWGGVVGSYADYYNLWWGKRPTPSVSPSPGSRGWWRHLLIKEFGDYNQNPAFWESISVTSALSELGAPIQFHHAKGDETVPYELSVKMKERMDAAGKPSELYVYEGDNHNLSGNFSTAMRRSVEFFRQYL